MKRSLYASTFVLIFFNGCLITRTQLEMKAKLDELDARLSIVEEKKVDTEELKASLDEIRGILADVSTRQDEIEKRLAVLKGAGEIEKAFAILSREIDQKISSVQKEMQKSVEAREEDLQQQLKSLKKELESLKLAYSIFAKVLADPEKAYEDAKELWKKGQSSQAYAIFSRIAAIHKGHHLEDDCYYLMGKIKAENGDCRTAIKNFGEVITRFPSSWLAPKAYLGTAECLKRLGEKKKARLFLREVIKKYPQSREATRAKKMLKKL